MDPRDENVRGEDEPLREEDVTAADRLDDRVNEAEGLADEPTERPEDDRR